MGYLYRLGKLSRGSGDVRTIAHNCPIKRNSITFSRIRMHAPKPKSRKPWPSLRIASVPSRSSYASQRCGWRPVTPRRRARHASADSPVAGSDASTADGGEREPAVPATADQWPASGDVDSDFSARSGVTNRTPPGFGLITCCGGPPARHGSAPGDDQPAGNQRDGGGRAGRAGHDGSLRRPGRGGDAAFRLPDNHRDMA